MPQHRGWFTAADNDCESFSVVGLSEFQPDSMRCCRGQPDRTGVACIFFRLETALSQRDLCGRDVLYIDARGEFVRTFLPGYKVHVALRQLRHGCPAAERS